MSWYFFGSRSPASNSSVLNNEGAFTLGGSSPVQVSRPTRSSSSSASSSTASAAQVDQRTNAYVNENVPFQVWNNDTNSFWSGRSGAILAVGKGTLFTLIDAIKYLFAQVFSKKEIINEASDNLSNQWQGLKLTLKAVYSPSAARTEYAQLTAARQNEVNLLD